MKIKKNILLLLIAVFMLTLFPCGCSAQNSENTVILEIGSTVISINGVESELDTAPIIKNDRTLLPLRAVMEGLGGSVDWKNETKTAFFSKGDKTISMTIGSKTAYVNTTEYTMDTEPVIIDGRTMLPIRFVAENLGFNVIWDERTRKITVTESEEVIQSKILVACFSATGHTKPLAEYAAKYLNADFYEIVPEEPYTDDDLNYNNSNSRTTKEQNDSSARPRIKGNVNNMAEYDTVIIAHPIWWGQAPKIIYTFLESYDFSGKTLTTMCTSGSSPVGSSAKNLMAITDNSVTWLESKRFAAGASEGEVQAWLDTIGLKAGSNDFVSKENELTAKINGQIIPVIWEDNESVTELKKQAEQSPVTVQMAMYGGFEQVGSLGRSYPSNDTSITTQNGDIVLYSSNNIVMFYGSNTWSYTRLGKINLPEDEVTELLGNGNVAVTISVE